MEHGLWRGGEGGRGGGEGRGGEGGERQCVREGGSKTLRTYSKANTYMHVSFHVLTILDHMTLLRIMPFIHGALSLSPIHVLHLPNAFLYPDILVLVC